MRALVIGGLGYLGSIISDKLSAHGTVDIMDCCLYDNEEVKKEIDHDNLFVQSTHGTIMDIAEYDTIVWCSDIDIDEYYDYDHYKSDQRFFEYCAKDSENFYYMGSFIEDIAVSDRQAYRDFVVSRKKLVLQNNGCYFRLPILYGPSPRMRWDTTVNIMIFYAIIQKNIFLMDDWLTRYSVCNVADAAEYMINQIKDGCREICEVSSENLSLIEMAHVVAKCFKDVEVSVTSPCVKNYLYHMNTTVARSTDIMSSVDMISRQLDSDMLPDFEKDKYNNELTIGNMLRGKRAYHSLMGK